MASYFICGSYLLFLLLIGCQEIQETSYIINCGSYSSLIVKQYNEFHTLLKLVPAFKHMCVLFFLLSSFSPFFPLPPPPPFSLIYIYIFTCTPITPCNQEYYSKIPQGSGSNPSIEFSSTFLVDITINCTSKIIPTLFVL